MWPWVIWAAAAAVGGAIAAAASWVVNHLFNAGWRYIQCANHWHSVSSWQWFGPFHVRCW